MRSSAAASGVRAACSAHRTGLAMDLVIGRAPGFVALPDAAGSALAMLPGGPVSRDQWKLLQHDSVVSPGAEGLDALGVARTPFAAVAPGWLVRYRRAGRFGTLSDA